MNIGPKGDGVIDAPDLEILAGMGKWMDVNEVSIRGTAGSTLPVQPWGESTRKHNTFYLHVFEWPADGTLELGGFTGQVNKAWLLSDQTQTALMHQRTDTVTVQFEVPAHAPDPANSVVVVEVDDVNKVETHRPLSNTTATVMRAFDGVAVGGGFKYGDGKASRNAVSKWKDDKHLMTWPVYLAQPGTFKVIAEYRPFKQPGGFAVEAGGVTLPGTTKSTQKGFVEHELGRVSLAAGNQTITIHPQGEREGDLMDLRAVHFVPVGAAGH